jgi:hypothetical protein
MLGVPAYRALVHLQPGRQRAHGVLAAGLEQFQQGEHAGGRAGQNSLTIRADPVRY